MIYDEFRPGRNRLGLGDEEEQDEYRRSILSQLGEEEPRERMPGPGAPSGPGVRFDDPPGGGIFHTQVERESPGVSDPPFQPEPPSSTIPEPPGRDDPRITYPEDPTRGQTPGEIDDELFGPEGPPDRGEGPVRTREGEMPPVTAAGAMAQGGGGQYRDYLEGFNFDKLDNPDRYTDANTAKYKFARIAENYDPGDPEALQNIVAELNAQGVPAQYDGRDKVDFGDGYGYIDVWEDHVPGQGGRAWWWGPQGGGTGGAGGGGGEGGGGGGFAGGSGPASANDAFGYLQSLVGPNASKDEMEAAIAAAFGNVPGFEEAYKESVKINGVWYDMVVGYGGNGAGWTDGLHPKEGQGASARGARPMGATSIASLMGGGGSSSGGGGRGPTLNSALQNSAVFEQIEEEIRRLIAGENPQNALLEQLGL